MFDHERFEGFQFGIGDGDTQEQFCARPVGGLAEEALGFVPREITDRVDEISGVSLLLAQFASFLESWPAQVGARTSPRLERAGPDPRDWRQAAHDLRLATRDSRLATQSPANALAASSAISAS